MIAGRTQERPPATLPVEAPLPRRAGTPPLVHGALLAVAFWLWLGGVASTDPADVTGFGLVAALPPPYFAGVAVLALGFLLAVARRPPSLGLPVLHVAVLTVMLHATTPLLYGEPRYAWLYKHLGVIDYIGRNGSVDRGVDIYQNWPAFFAANAWLEDLIGVRAIDYAEWAQVAFGLGFLAAFVFLVRGLTADVRLQAIATWLFVLGNWVAQDYLAPQAFAYLLSLVVLGLCLRAAPSPAPPRLRVGRVWRAVLERGRAAATRGRLPPPGPSRAAPPLGPRAALAVGAACYLTVVVSHQLSPVFLILGVGAIALTTGRIPLWIPGAMVAVEAAWVALALPLVGERFQLFSANPTGNVQPPGPDLSAGLPGLETVGVTWRVLIASLVLLAAVGIVRRLRAGHWDLHVAALAAAPVLVLGAQSYGGEALFRVYLFMLPWLAFLAAAACLPASGRRGRLPGWLAHWRLAGITAVAASCLLVSYFGLEYGNRMRPTDIAAALWYERNAPPGSLMTVVNWNMPYGLTADYARSTRISVLSEEPGLDLRRPPSPREIEEIMLRFPATERFVVITPSQDDYLRLYGRYGPGAAARLRASLRASPDFERVYEREGSVIYRHTGA